MRIWDLADGRCAVAWPGLAVVGAVPAVGDAVAIYADDSAAQNTFNQLKTKLTACPALGVKNYDYTIDDSDPSALTLSTNVWTVVYRLKSAALINVAALGLNQPQPTARTLAQSISDRIPE